LYQKWENEKPSVPVLLPLEMKEHRLECLMWALLSEHQLNNPLITVEVGNVKIGSANVACFNNFAHFNQPPIIVVLVK
jgi:hypothetical protein